MRDATNARRVLFTLLTKHHPKETLDERLKAAELFVVEFLTMLARLPKYRVDEIERRENYGFISYKPGPDGCHRLTLADVGTVKLRVNTETAAIEMMPIHGAEWKAAALTLDIDAQLIHSTQLDRDYVPVRGGRMPRKDAMQVLAELFAELVESPSAR